MDLWIFIDRGPPMDIWKYMERGLPNGHMDVYGERFPQWTYGYMYMERGSPNRRRVIYG